MALNVINYIRPGLNHNETPRTKQIVSDLLIRVTIIVIVPLLKLRISEDFKMGYKEATEFEPSQWWVSKQIYCICQLCSCPFLQHCCDAKIIFRWVGMTNQNWGFWGWRVKPFWLMSYKMLMAQWLLAMNKGNMIVPKRSMLNFNRNLGGYGGIFFSKWSREEIGLCDKW